jgi:hypothetical protein
VKNFKLEASLPTVLFVDETLLVHQVVLFSWAAAAAPLITPSVAEQHGKLGRNSRELLAKA